MELLGHKTAVRKAAGCAIQWLNILESVMIITLFPALVCSVIAQPLRRRPAPVAIGYARKFTQLFSSAALYFSLPLLLHAQYNRSDTNQLKSLYQKLVAAPSILTGLKGCQSYSF